VHFRREYSRPWTSWRSWLLTSQTNSKIVFSTTAIGRKKPGDFGREEELPGKELIVVKPVLSEGRGVMHNSGERIKSKSVVEGLLCKHRTGITYN
jgi:hydrogenase maturation factor